MTTLATRTHRGSCRTRRAAIGLAALGAAAAGAIALPSTASAAPVASTATVQGTVNLGPGFGLRCVRQWASSSAVFSGTVVSGSGANFQLRFSTSPASQTGDVQVAGSGAQVQSYSVSTQQGNPTWRGPGYYFGCARNNLSFATADLSLQTT